MKRGLIFLLITALISCESKKQDKQIDKEINRGTIAITARDTTDVLNIYKLNIEEGDLNSIQTTWAGDARWLNAFGRVFVQGYDYSLVKKFILHAGLCSIKNYQAG